MLSNERKKELYHGWCKKSDWTEEEERAWEMFLGSLAPEEQQYIERLELLHDEWNESALLPEEENYEWYDSLTLEEQAIVDEWDKLYLNRILILCEKIQEIKENETLRQGQ